MTTPLSLPAPLRSPLILFKWENHDGDNWQFVGNSGVARSQVVKLFVAAAQRLSRNGYLSSRLAVTEAEGKVLFISC